MPRQRSEEEKGKFGGGHGVAARSVHHDHSPLGGRFHIHIVHPHAGTADHPKLRGGINHFFRHFGLRSHHHGLHLLDEGEKLSLGGPFLEDGHIKFRALTKKFDAFGRDGSQINTFIKRSGENK